MHRLLHLLARGVKRTTSEDSFEQVSEQLLILFITLTNDFLYLNKKGNKIHNQLIDHYKGSPVSARGKNF